MRKGHSTRFVLNVSNDARGFPADVSTAVAFGEKLYFIVNRNADTSYDSTVWDVTVTRH